MSSGAAVRVPPGITALYLFNTTIAAAVWPVGIWLAITRDWTIIFAPVGLTALVATGWFAYHAVRRRVARLELQRGQK